MSTLPIEDEKDLRLITDMDFANDTSSEEKAALRKWTKLMQELESLKKEIERCTGEMQKVEGDKAALALAIHIDGLKTREEPLAEEVGKVWVEFETLREKMEPVRKEKAAFVRNALYQGARLTTAQDIIEAGCTGLFEKLELNKSWLHAVSRSALEVSQSVRENMGGARVSLTCFVGPDKYCLVHQTIGGLQHGQKPQHVEQVQYVSRELTPKEKGHVALVENVRRREGSMRDGKMILTGQKLPEDLNVQDLSPQDTAFKEQMATSSVPSQAPLFVCPEHGVLVWGCRFCLAQAVAEGTLEPALIEDDGRSGITYISTSEVEERLRALEIDGTDAVAIYVRAVRFIRRLARE